MNRIVRQNYPVSKLPAELREGIDPGAKVTVVVEEQVRPTAEQLAEMLVEARKHAPGVTAEEAVARVRALRDEWDD